MHPHPGFPVLQRLDDFCGACAPELPSVPTDKKKVRVNPATLAPAGCRAAAAQRAQGAEPSDSTGYGRLAAVSIAAVALVATTAFLLRRRSS